MKTKDVENIIKDSLGLASSGQEAAKDQGINEAYVAQPKVYNQNTNKLSKQTKKAHSEIYKHYIDSFNSVSAQLDAARLHDGTPNPDNSVFRLLKQNEISNMNAVWLHELYFANSSDTNSEIHMESLAYMKLQQDFGNFDEWQKDFISCALVTGVGWACTGYNVFLRRFHNFFVEENANSIPMGTYPVIVLDMWEHASRDYMTKRKEYVFGQLKELNWSVVEDRFKKAIRIAEASK